jgi:hypothetical protein
MREGGGVGAVGHTTRLQYYDPFCLLLEGLEPTSDVGTLSWLLTHLPPEAQAHMSPSKTKRDVRSNAGKSDLGTRTITTYCVALCCGYNDSSSSLSFIICYFSILARIPSSAAPVAISYCSVGELRS